MQLATTEYGTNAAAPPVLIVHGLFGSARNWTAIARGLSAARRVITVDLRNHGNSGHAPSHTYADMAGDLAGVIAECGGQADVIGHSMGGKVAIALALGHPGCVRGLVVADIAPVAYGHSQIHLIDALRAVDLSRITTRRAADVALGARVPEAGVRAFLLQSLDIGAKRWRLNLEVLAAFMPDIIGWPDPPGQFAGPALFLSGGESDYVRAEHRGAIRAQFPRARFAKLPGAGHWLHADRPREFAAAVEAFLRALGPGGAGC
ncbi:MAG: alpha/beta fold hydrolase [Rhodobacteraceae bacterium]|nr:alpha/beta fold hydrolase [Paracoccaceae bacterium]